MDEHALARWLTNSGLDPGSRIEVARAPGRLDVLGGIADYSGALVLEYPLACATHVAVQAAPVRGHEPRIDLCSVDRDGHSRRASLPLRALDPPEGLSGPALDAAVGHAIEAHSGAAWPRYVAGALHMLASRFELPSSAWRIAIHSDIPEGAGISSSAALEVATIRALCDWHGLDLDAERIAHLAQHLENHVVGAPCGIMDQMTVAAGRADRLLALRCDPCSVEGHLHPGAAGLAVIGIDSGIRHSVSGPQYRTARTATFMGKRILGLPAESHLAQAGAEVLTECQRLPESLSGAGFLDHFGPGLNDDQSPIDADTTYPVRAATEFPIREHQRALALRAAIESGRWSATTIGDLLHASAAGYSACGLGHPATDAILDRVRARAADPSSGVVGGRTSGGGCGGTVAVIVESARIGTATEALREDLGPAQRLLAGSSGGTR